MKKTLLSALLLSSLAGIASAQVGNTAPTDRYFDALTSATAYSGVAAGSAPVAGSGNVQTGMIIDLANFTTGTSVMTGLDVPIGNLTGQPITAAPVRLNVWIWNTVNGTAAGATPLFSNQVVGLGGANAPTLVFNLPSFTLNTGFLTQVIGTFPALAVAPTAGSRIGISFNWQIDNGAGFVNLLNLNTTVIGGATQLPPATGTNAFAGATGGYLRSANSDIDVNGQFAGGSARNIGNNSAVPFAIYGISGVTPVTTGACCVGGVASIVTEADCATNGGTYLGDNTSAVGTGTNITSADIFPIDIPDFVADPAAPAISTIVSTDPSTITSLAVKIGLTHTFVGDLTATLSNGVTTVTLFNGVGGGTNLAGVYTLSDLATVAFGTGASPLATGEYRPVGLLSDFGAAAAAGTWTLTVTDNGAIDVGTIDSFELVINPSACNTPVCLADVNNDNVVDGSDFIAFVNSFGVGDVTIDPIADVNADLIIDGGDFVAFINAFGAGC